MAVLKRVFGSNGGDENGVGRPSFNLARWSTRQNSAEPGRTVLATGILGTERGATIRTLILTFAIGRYEVSLAVNLKIMLAYFIM